MNWKAFINFFLMEIIKKILHSSCMGKGQLSQDLKGLTGAWCHTLSLFQMGFGGICISSQPQRWKQGADTAGTNAGVCENHLSSSTICCGVLLGTGRGRAAQIAAVEWEAHLRSGWWDPKPLLQLELMPFPLFFVHSHSVIPSGVCPT